MDKINVVLDVINTIILGTGAVVAYRGLNIWREQLKGKGEYDLAKRYLRAAYKVRNALNDARNPWIPRSETTAALKERGFEDAESDERNKNFAVYSLRWKKVQDALLELDGESLEAEVAWGRDAVQARDELDAAVRALRNNISTLYDSSGNSPDDDVLYLTNRESDFDRTLRKAVEKIETFLKRYL